MGWLIALLILVCLAILPLGVRVRYNSQGAYVWLLLGAVRIRLIPGKKKANKAEKPKKPKKKKEKSPRQVGKQQPDSGQKEESPKESGGSLLDFLPLVRTALDFLGDFGRKLRVNNLELKIIMAGGDPCNLAVNYGRAWSALGNLMPRLERHMNIWKRSIEVECDFTAEETLVIAAVDITITLGRLVAATVRFAWRAIRQFLKIQKKRKGGVKQ